MLPHHMLQTTVNIPVGQIWTQARVWRPMIQHSGSPLFSLVLPLAAHLHKLYPNIELPFSPYNFFSRTLTDPAMYPREIPVSRLENTDLSQTLVLSCWISLQMFLTQESIPNCNFLFSVGCSPVCHLNINYLILYVDYMAFAYGYIFPKNFLLIHSDF